VRCDQRAATADSKGRQLKRKAQDLKEVVAEQAGIAAAQKRMIGDRRDQTRGSPHLILVEQPHLPTRRPLPMLWMKPSTFYR
jgi:hypothetical protein